MELAGAARLEHEEKARISSGSPSHPYQITLGNCPARVVGQAGSVVIYHRALERELQAELQDAGSALAVRAGAQSDVCGTLTVSCAVGGA